MKISIITVSFNAQDTILDTIKSVNKQTYGSIEHIFVDGGSTDNTLNIIKGERKRPGEVIFERDRGIFDAMNKGIKAATGDLIAFLNADDFYLDGDVIQRVSRVFQEQSIQGCFSDLLYVDRLKPSRVIRYWKSSAYAPQSFEKGWVPAHPTFFCRKEVYEKFGNFNLDFGMASDFELLYRLIELNQIKTAYIAMPIVCMRIGGASNKAIEGVIKQNITIIKLLKYKNTDFSVTRFLIFKVSSRLAQFYKAGAKAFRRKASGL